MSFAREIRRGFFLNARFGVNGTQNASRSFGTVGASGRVASDMSFLLQAAENRRTGSDRPYIRMKAHSECPATVIAEVYRAIQTGAEATPPRRGRGTGPPPAARCRPARSARWKPPAHASPNGWSLRWLR